jgi:hypothetical protein
LLIGNRKKKDMSKEKRWLHEEADKPLSPVIGYYKLPYPFEIPAPYYAKKMTYLPAGREWCLQILAMQAGSLMWIYVYEDQLIKEEKEV